MRSVASLLAALSRYSIPPLKPEEDKRTRCLLFLLHRSGITDNPQDIITVSQDLAGQHSDD